jgi:hypothetical protein
MLPYCSKLSTNGAPSNQGAPRSFLRDAGRSIGPNTGSHIHYYLCLPAVTADRVAPKKLSFAGSGRYTLVA